MTERKPDAGWRPIWDLLTADIAGFLVELMSAWETARTRLRRPRR